MPVIYNHETIEKREAILRKKVDAERAASNKKGKAAVAEVRTRWDSQKN